MYVLICAKGEKKQYNQKLTMLVKKTDWHSEVKNDIIVKSDLCL